VDGKPVVFVYGRVMNQVPLNAWSHIIRGVRERLAGDFLLIADGYDEAYGRMFDGVHTYNICGWVRDKTPDELRELTAKSFADAVSLARRHGKISCLTVIPGYDDTKIRTPGLRAERLDGRTYQVLWDEAIRAGPDWVLITSWNEWHEGSEIEPSWEDGDKYIRLTGPGAARLHTSPRAQAAASERSGLSREDALELQERFKGKTIGVLPDFGGEFVFWLADSGLDLKELAWRDLLDPRIFNATELPLVLYAAGEHYTRSAQQEDDVIRALQRYLLDGGFLVALPSRPYPFYYDETGRPNIAAGRVGLPISGSRSPRRGGSAGPLVQAWETPPADVSLTFHVDTQQLPSLPGVAPFPEGGDLRWRPATGALLTADDEYTPLAQLKDDRGGHYGDAIAYVEHKSPSLSGGKTLYVWMRMPDALGANETFLALMRFIAKRLTQRR
jgi:hypothetical protein